tara:strand:+ start:124 stop:606 length:483 start_codon:yes stop_codon:yes gene_type:complete
MKKLHHIFIFFFTFNCWSDNDYLVVQKQLKSDVKNYELPSGAQYSLYIGKGTFQDNFGNYGKTSCMGRILTDNKKNVNLSVMCQTIDQNNFVYYEDGYRKSQEMEAGAGKSNIIEGTGPWKSLIDVKCNFAIKYKDEIGFVLVKCPISKNQKTKLLNYER